MKDLDFFDEFSALGGDKEASFPVMERDIMEEPLGVENGQYLLDEACDPITSIDAGVGASKEGLLDAKEVFRNLSFHEINPPYLVLVLSQCLYQQCHS